MTRSRVEKFATSSDEVGRALYATPPIKKLLVKGSEILQHISTKKQLDQWTAVSLYSSMDKVRLDRFRSKTALGQQKLNSTSKNWNKLLSLNYTPI